MDSHQRDARGQHSLEGLFGQEDPGEKHHPKGGKANLQSKTPEQVVSGAHSNVLPVLAPLALGLCSSVPLVGPRARIQCCRCPGQEGQHSLVSLFIPMPTDEILQQKEKKKQTKKSPLNKPQS